MSDFYFRWSSPRKNSLYDLSSMGSKWFFRVDKLKLGNTINRSPVIIHGYNPIGLFFQRMWLASVNEPVYAHTYTERSSNSYEWETICTGPVLISILIRPLCTPRAFHRSKCKSWANKESTWIRRTRLRVLLLFTQRCVYAV